MAVEAALDELFSPSSSYNREDYRICRERVHVPEEKARVSGMNFGERNRELDSLQAHRRPLLAGSNTSEHQAFGLGSGFRSAGVIAVLRLVYACQKAAEEHTTDEP
jgi:hypothetical protein